MTVPIRWLASLALALATCCASAPSQSNARDSDWTSLATAPRQSFLNGDGLQRDWTGADGQRVALAVMAPQLADHATVITLRPALRDNGPPIEAALARLRAAGGGTLRLAPGIYPVAGGPPAITMDGLTDVLIDGNGAQLVFANWGDGILIRNVARLAIHGLSVGYAQPAVVPALVRGGTLAFDGGTPAGQTAYQVTGTGTRGERVLLGKQGRALKRLGSGRVALIDTPLDSFADGAAVSVKLSYYSGAAIRILDSGDQPQSHDVTLDGIAVRNSAGGGVVVDLMGRGLAIRRSHFGGDTSNPTIGYDALHVTAMTGDILVEENTFIGSGDDAINLASPIFDASVDAGGRSGIIGGKAARVYPGARLALFDDALQFVGVAQVTARAPRDAKGAMATSFAAPVTSGRVRYARNMDLLGIRYAVIDNQIEHCICHGVLVQNPNGMVRGNRFAGLRYNAIRVVTSAAWMEGAGAQNVVIDRNQIADTGGDGVRGRVWAAITVFGELASGGVRQPQLAATPIHARLLLRDNQITGVDQGCISVASAVDVKLTHNNCANFDRRTDAARMLLERTNVGAAARRIPSKATYMARGNGIWIDPLSTARVQGGSDAY